MQKSSGSFYTHLDLKFDTAQMRIKIDREKAGTLRHYDATNQPYFRVASYLPQPLSVWILTAVLIKLFPSKTDNRLSSKFNKYYITAANGTSVPLSSLVTATRGTTTNIALVSAS